MSIQLWTGGPKFEDRWRNTTMYANATGVCKIRRGCNILQVPVQIITLGVPKKGNYLRRGACFVMACLWIKLRYETQTVSKSLQVTLV